MQVVPSHGQLLHSNTCAHAALSSSRCTLAGSFVRRKAHKNKRSRQLPVTLIYACGPARSRCLHSVCSIGLLDQELHPLICQAISAFALSTGSQALDESNRCAGHRFDEAWTLSNAKSLLLLICKDRGLLSRYHSPDAASCIDCM